MLVSIPQNYAFLFTSPQFADKKISNKTLIDVKPRILRLYSSELAKKSATLNKMHKKKILLDNQFFSAADGRSRRTSSMRVADFFKIVNFKPSISNESPCCGRAPRRKMMYPASV